jgi:hypothetical protein
LSDKEKNNYTNKSQVKAKDLMKNEIIVVDEGIDDDDESHILS